MDQQQAQKIALGAGVIAILLAIASGRLPRWLRIILVFAIVILACGAGLYAYRNVTAPKTVTIAVGSIDGDAARIMSAVASRMATTGSLVRLQVIDKGTALEATKAFASGEADLAVARGDVGDLSAARAVVIITHAVALLVVPPGSTMASMDDLKGKAVGVIGGDLNHQLVEVITKEYDLVRAKVQFKNLALKDIQPAFQSKQVSALLVVMPISEKYLSMLREMFPAKGKQALGLIPIESAGAIAAIARAYESYDLPKGTVRGSPPIPDDDLTTLRVPFYLVANKKLDDDVVGNLTKAFMDARRDLLGEYPLLAQITAPSTDKDAFIPVHPGAKAYFDGDQKSFFDKYGDQLFYGSMLLGTLGSLLAAGWKFMTKGAEGPEARPLIRLYTLMDRIAQAKSEAELAEIEQNIDEIVRAELEQYASGNDDSTDAAALGLVTQRLESAMGRRRKTFDVGAAMTS